MRRCYQNNAAQQLKSQVKIADPEDALLLESQGVSTKGAKVNLLGLNLMF